MNASVTAPMKHTINLYTQELRPVQQRFTLALTLKVVLGWLLALVLIGLLLFVLASQQQQQVDTLATAVQSQRNEVTQLTEQLRSRTVDPQLQQRLSQTRADMAQLEQLLATLSTQETQHQTSFATLLSDLADIARDDLWLRHIALDQGNLKLEGFATKAAALPRWMADFNGKATLQNRQFAVFELRDETTQGHDGLAFTLSSVAEGASPSPQPASAVMPLGPQVQP